MYSQFLHSMKMKPYLVIQPALPDLTYLEQQQQQQQQHFISPHNYHKRKTTTPCYSSFRFLCEHSCIPEAIASMLGDDNTPFIIVYQPKEDKTTYLPNLAAWSSDMLQKICTR